MKIVKTLLLSIPFLLFGTASVAQITSNFSVNNDGWSTTVVSAGQTFAPTYNSSGGNPGGYLSVELSAALPTPYYFYADRFFEAPAKFLGNRSFSYNKNLTFDLQQSISGTDNTAAEVTITGGGFTIFFPVSSFPATATWSSYSVLLKETAGWKTGSLAGAATTFNEMKTVLSNVTSIRIRSQFMGSFTGTYSGRLDNVVLNVATLGTPPSITSFSPSSGIPDVTSVTINGNNFNSTAVNNSVYFGGVKATVTSASATQLVVKVPKGAQNAAITVVNLSTGREASTVKPFSPLFDNNKDFGGQIIRASMDPVVSFDLDATRGTTAVGDIDGDGKNDIVVGEGDGSGGLHKFSVFRNTAVAGAVTSSSFAPKVSFNTTSPNAKAFIAMADFDGDGKLDVAVSNASASAYVSVFRNTSTIGAISFAAAIDLIGLSYSDGPLDIADIDGDGRPEILSVFNNSCASGDRLYIYQNMSSPGNIDFAAFITFGVVNTCGGHITVGDLDGDNLTDVIVEAGTVTVFKNTSTPGNLAMATPFVLGNTANGRPVIADLDNDGKVDVGWPKSFTDVELRKNIYAGGAFDATSFSSAIVITAGIGSANGTSELVAGDINSDGKLDLVLSGDTDLGILQNVSTAGTLNTTSFLKGIPYATNLGTSYFEAPVIADFDGDYKSDVVMKNTGSPTKLLIFRNECYPNPNLDNLAPTSGPVNSTVNFTGGNLATGISPAVRGRVGAIKANTNVTSNTAGSTVVPATAISGKVSFTEHGLTSLGKPFPVTFGTNKTIDATTFANSIDFPLTGTTRAALDIADFDDDGKIDIVTIENGVDVKVFQNTQATAAQPITSGSLTKQVTSYTAGYNLIAFDIDGDGVADLNSGYGLLKNNSTAGSISFSNGPSGAYTYAGGFNYVATGDFNHDGKTDLATTGGSAFVQIYQNESTKEPFVNNANLSTFNVNAISLVKPSNYGGIVAEDFDGDGYDDIVAVSPNTNNFSIYQNQKLYGPITTSSFSVATNIATGDQPNGVTASDFDGDGKIDIAITYNSDIVTFISVCRNTSTVGSISFAARVDFTCVKKGYNIASQDLDGDGLAEIVVIHLPNPGPGSFSVFQNKSTSGVISFNAPINYSLTSQSRNPQALAIADINQDQKPDILIVGNPYSATSSALMVFENKIASGAVITISPQPISAAVCDGASSSFTLTATGTTNLAYQWQKFDGTVFNNITNTGGYSGTTTSTLAINTTGNFGAGDYRCKVSGDLAADVFSNRVTLTVNTIPVAPTTTGASNCVAAALTLSASGGSNGQYRWYTVATGGTAIAGQINSSYVTPVIATTTNYYVAINNGFCESSRTPVIATIAPLAKPILTPSVQAVGGIVNICQGDSLTVTAPSGFANYTWSNGATTNPVYIKKSTTSLTLQVKDGSGCTSPVSDPLAIVVNPIPSAIITVNGTELTTSAGDSYQWYQNGTLVPGATSQSFEFNILEYGVYKVDVTDNGCKSTSAEFEYLITSIEKLSGDLQVYPNPITAGELIVSSPQDATLKMFDVLGRKVKEAMLVKGSPNVISVHELQAGNYIIAIQSAKTTQYMRIQKR